MLVRKFALFLVYSLGLVVSSASAQSEARIRAVIPSIELIESDLKWLVEQSPTADLKKQWKPLKEDILDALTQGVDLSMPISVDIVFRKDELAYEYRIPVGDLAGKNGFLEGIKGIGFTVKEVTKNSYYEFKEKKDKNPFYLRFDRHYAWISKTPIPGNPPEATQDLKSLLALEKDVIASLKNEADGLAARRENFKALRGQFEALIKFRRNEEQSAFELRKLALVQQLNEAERFVVETEDLQVSWTTSTVAPTPFGRGELSLTALPGTDLEASIEEFAVKPSYFANVTLHPNPVASGKLTYPLDSLRIKHLKEFFKTVRPALDSQIGLMAGKSNAQKTATKQAMNLFFDMLDVGLALRVVDAFVDGHAPEPGKNVIVCGIRAIDGKNAEEIIKLLPQIDDGWQIKSDSQEHGGVKIHELTVSKSRLAAFQKIFGAETVLYVGTHKDSVWCAAGINAMKYLTSAIDQAALPAPETTDPIVLNYQFQLDQLVNLTDLVQKKEDLAPKKDETSTGSAPKTKEQLQHEKEQRQREKDVEKYRKLAQDSMGGCNALLHGELRRTGKKIEGFLEINDCVMKYIGSMIADGVKVLQ